MHVGGVSAYDYASSFEQIEVKQSSSVVDASIKTINNASVVNLGSIVGEGYRSKILSCSSELQYNVNCNEVTTANAIANIGGLVGMLDGYYYDTEEHIDRYEGLIASSTYSGKITVTSNEGVYVGGIIASAKYTRISDSKVFIENETENVEIQLLSTNNNYIGGIIATSNMCSVSDCIAEVTVCDKEIKADVETIDDVDTDTTYYVGGITGYLANESKVDKDIENSYAKLTYNLIKTNNAYIGGIVGHMASNNSAVLNRLASEITIKVDDRDDDEIVVVGVVDNMVVGGIVGLTSGNVVDGKALTINDSMAIMNCNIEYNSSLVGGGIIGKATGSYSINNSTAMGQLFANNELGVQLANRETSTLTVLGGLVGLAGDVNGCVIAGGVVEQEINNTYSALTISMAGMYRGDTKITANENDVSNIYSHDVIANALVGYTDSSNTITGKGVVYSSDYNLTFDDNTVFENQPTNVTANVLINSNTTLQPNTEVDANPLNGYIGSKWIWKQGYLPMPSELQNLLTLMGIVETQVDSDGNITVKFVQGNEGSAYNPIMFKEGELNNYTFAKDDEYKYYLLSSSETIGNSLGSLNGVVLGNNNIISTTTTIFGEIAKHSAISNLTVNLTVPLTENSQFTVIDGEGKGGVANINNGTIFMLGVQYDNNLSVPNKFGGIVGINNGLISNCYNMGNTNVADSVTDVGGLAYHSTENASIEDSYFTGSFTSVDGDNKTLIGAALAFTNQGNVSNCYSAGMATHFIGDLQESLDVARYENLYFDYYANYTTTDVYKDLETYGIIGKSTREMQVVTIEDELKTSNSALLSGWKVYSMYNWDDLLTADATISTTYNYGYPIHNIQQLKLDGTVKPIEVRVKQTGNGSFNAFMDDSGNYIIDSDYLNKNARGKIVSTLDATNGTIYYDSFPFLINNLGVLHLVNEVDDTSNKYFELEIDIILPLDNTVQYKESDENNYQLLSNWSGIGTASHPFAGVFTTSASVEDGNYTLDRTLLDETIDEYGINFNNDAKIIKNDAPKTIANLNGSALFNYVENGAVITNVILEDSRVSTAPLIENVGTTDADYLVKSNFAPVVFNVKVDGSVTTNSTGSISGLVNNINLTDTLNLHSIDTSIEIVTFNEGNGNRCSTASGVINTNSGTVNVKNSFKSTNVTMTNATITTVAGFINQNLASGVINLVDGISITLNSKENNEKSINGFVVENFGTILTLGETSSVKVGEIGKTATYIAGLVGLMQNGVVGGFDVTFEGTEGDEYQSQVFGGVVAYLYGGQVGQRGQDIDGNNRPINVTLATATTNNFGGVVAHVAKSAEDAEGVTGSISNVIIKSVSEQIVVKQLSDSEANSYGLIIGRYEQALGEINYELNDETIFKVDSKNVGGIIGIATNGTFNFVNEMPAIINVFGTGNVGGFIGQYAGETSLVMNGNTWLVDEQTSAGNQVTGFANVGIFMPTAPKSGKVAAQASNFGGLIGYWNSTADLKCENEEGELLIVNNNQVLTFDNLSSDDQNKIDWFKNTVKGINQYDYMVSNIGGVVGYANASITNAKNNATVGFEIEDLSNLNEHESNNPISGTSLTEGLETPTIINQFMQFMYIGGVAGCVEGQNITITNCSNTSSVYGMYAVGGVIGGALSDIAITFDDMYQAVEESVTIAGFADIGGTIGKAQGLTLNTSIEGGVEIMLDYVVGITNVGGIAGYATNANISNLTITETTNAIVGNLNVGGVVGYATSGEIINTTVKDVKVYGTAFDYKYEVWNTEEGKNKLTPFYYLPTNIGGIAGYIGGESKFSKVTANADVMTDEKFLIDGDGNETVVNIASNYIGSIADISNKKTISVEMGKQFVSYLESYYGTASVKGESVDGGIGGFAGRLNSPNFMTVDEDGASASAYSECQVLGSVYAPLGINVGGVIGYLNHDQAIELPILPQSQDTNGDNVIDDTDEAFNVAGKLYVGGYIGKNNGFTSATTEFFKLNPTGYVNVQQYVDNDENQVLSGNYIGGIIGYSTGEVNNIKLVYNADTNPKAKIKVFNSNSGFIDSSYVGALVGRIDTNMYGCEISAEFCDAENGYYEYDTVAGIIQSPKVYNYGGLVGVVDVPTDSKGSNGINILGKHYYPFTVEMVQNRDYLQGQTQYDYTDDTLTAIAHYINMSDINVSASALKSLFDGKEDSLARDDHNPTNTLANGWAKEYTMFRMMARVIEQPDEPTGDSVQVIYSANYITEVECTYKDYSEDIIYTIYQPLGQVAQLYCKYGIARESVDFKPNNDEGTVAYEKDYMVTLEGDRSAWTWKNEAGDTDRHAFWTNVKDLTGLGVTGSQITDGMKTQVETLATTHQRTLGSSYYVNDNYLSKDKTYFEFILVFGFIKNADGDAEEDISLYSKSGSLFEVTGTVSNIAIEGVKERQEAWKGWRIIAGVGVVLLALMAFSPLGGIVIGAISKVLFALKIYASASTIIGAVGAFLITVSGTAMIQSLDTSYTTVLNSYLGIQDKSMGYLYSAYGRQITWNNGELNPYMDSYIVINVDNIKINGTNIDTSRYQGNNYNQFLLDGMNIDSTNKTCTLPLTYFNCSSSLALPSNINQSMTVLVEDMQDSDVKTIFEEIGIESYEVPMYRVVDNELYVYSSDAIVGKTLYPNYADAKDLIKELEIDEYQLIDKNGYAYLLINLDDTNDEYIVPAGDAEYLYTTYGIDRIVQENLTHSISESSSGATKQVILSELRWTAKIGHVDTLDTLQFNTTFKYAGTDSPTGVYSVYRNAINDNGDIYYLNESGAYVSVQDGTPYNGELSANTTAYFTLNGTGSASINVTLTPKRGGNGLTSNDLGVTGDYYYVYAEGGKFNIPCDFGLCNKTQFNVGNSAYVYDKTSLDIGDEYLEATKITIYSYNPEKGDAESISDFFGAGITISLSELQKNYSDYCDYSMSNTHYDAVSNNYILDGNKLVLKTINSRYLVDSSTGTPYVYLPTYGGIDSPANYNNRYVYYTTVDGKNIKFYTRFKYDGKYTPADGIPKTIKFLEDESISSRLIPDKIEDVNKNILFTEGVRVSLSAGNQRIYTIYESTKNNVWINATYGTLSCDDSHL
ncbi:MAG: hypothetical protein IJ358_00980 [Clostridia bacterium]|nr:hypothetical protein [Clostridia bacterium]